MRFVFASAYGVIRDEPGGYVVIIVGSCMQSRPNYSSHQDCRVCGYAGINVVYVTASVARWMPREYTSILCQEKKLCSICGDGDHC